MFDLINKSCLFKGQIDRGTAPAARPTAPFMDIDYIDDVGHPLSGATGDRNRRSLFPGRS